MRGTNVKINISCYEISLAQGHPTVFETEINLNYLDKSVHTPKRTDYFSITKTEGLIMLREVIAVYCKTSYETHIVPVWRKLKSS